MTGPGAAYVRMQTLDRILEVSMIDGLVWKVGARRPMPLAVIAVDETMATSDSREDGGSTRTSEQLGGYARTLLLSLT